MHLRLLIYFAMPLLTQEKTVEDLDIVIYLYDDILSYFKQEKQTDKDDLISQVTERADSSGDATFEKIEDIFRQSSIEDSVREINNALTDLQFLLESKDSEKDTYEATFIRSSGDAIKYARSLPGLIKNTVPGFKNSFLKTYCDKTRCNMTNIHVFHSFYQNLSANGMLIELLSKYLQSENITLEMERAFWAKSRGEIDEAFMQQENNCKEQFYSLLMEDMRNSRQNPRVLQKNNSERYDDRWNDVIFVPLGLNTSVFYYEASSRYFFRDESDGYLKIVVMESKTATLSEHLKDTVVDIEKNFPVFGKVEEAKTFAGDIMKYVQSKRVQIAVILLIFQHPMLFPDTGEALSRGLISLKIDTAFGETDATIYLVLSDKEHARDLIYSDNSKPQQPTFISSVQNALPSIPLVLYCAWIAYMNYLKTI